MAAGVGAIVGQLFLGLFVLLVELLFEPPLPQTAVRKF